MNSADFRTARKALGLTQSGIAEALRLSPTNGDRTIRLWETEGNTVPGPAQVAVECLTALEALLDARHGTGAGQDQLEYHGILMDAESMAEAVIARAKGAGT